LRGPYGVQTVSNCGFPCGPSVPVVEATSGDSFFNVPEAFDEGGAEVIPFPRVQFRDSLTGAGAVIGVEVFVSLTLKLAGA
jgi:hypothetical protein